MLRFYYTGASSFLAPQSKASLSTGNYVSSSLTPNDVFSNLFGEISSFTVDNNRAEYLILALKNETGGDLSDIQVYYDYDVDNYAKLEISAVIPFTDDCGGKSFEKIPDKFSRPLSAQFIEANGVENTVSIGGLLQDEYIGIWFKRTLTETGSGSIPKNESSINSCDNVHDRFLNNEELAKEENIEFKVIY